LKHYLVPRAHIGRNDRKREGQLIEGQISEELMQKPADPIAAEQTLVGHHRLSHLPPIQAAHLVDQFFKRIPTGGVQRSNHASSARSGHKTDRYPCLLQHVQYTEMGDAAGRSPAQSDSEFGHREDSPKIEKVLRRGLFLGFNTNYYLMTSSRLKRKIRISSLPVHQEQDRILFSHLRRQTVIILDRFNRLSIYFHDQIALPKTRIRGRAALLNLSNDNAPIGLGQSVLLGQIGTQVANLDSG
jgi:hypothetical protein